MTNAQLQSALYTALEQNPSDAVTLLALADVYEEVEDLNAAECLRWTVQRKKRPFRYDPDQRMKVTYTGWHKGWYWWARLGDGYHWGHPVACRLPITVWRQLSHTFKYNPRVFKEYPSLRQAYEALYQIWPRVKGCLRCNNSSPTT
jgi:hypothetical protein